MTPKPSSARLVLFLMSLATLARSAGLNAVRVYALMLLVSANLADSDVYPSSLVLWVAFAAVPALSLAPIAGWVAGSGRGARVAMGVGNAISLGVVLLAAFAVPHVTWLACLAVLLVDAYFFSVSRMTAMPVLARIAGKPITHLHGRFGAAAVLGGLLGAIVAFDFDPNRNLPGMPAPVQVAIVGYGLAFLFLLPVCLLPLPGETPRAGGGMLRPFGRVVAYIFRHPMPRTLLWVTVLLVPLTLAVGDVLLRKDWFDFSLALLIGVVVGGLNGHTWRSVGWIAWAALGLVAIALFGLVFGTATFPVWTTGILLGLCYAPVLAGWSDWMPEDLRACGFAFLGLMAAIAATILTLTVWGIREDIERVEPTARRIALGLTLTFAVIAWWRLYRAATELSVEGMIGWLYVIEGEGDGMAGLPMTGPKLVIANHSAWFDPLWLAKVVPGPITPMMVSNFYDLPVISFLMRRVVKAIRVENSGFRREAPELARAVEALDRGETVVIFPEGWLRRKEEIPLKRFARGIWEILRQRPETPVYACWIEGGWGSYTSWKGGPPTKNKRMDFRYPIRVAMRRMRVLDAATLAEHMKTRGLLMHDVAEARNILELPPVEITQFPVEGSEEE